MSAKNIFVYNNMDLLKVDQISVQYFLNMFDIIQMENTVTRIINSISMLIDCCVIGTFSVHLNKINT